MEARVPWEHEARFESLSRYSIKIKGKERNAIYSSDKRNESDKENPVLVLHSEKLDHL